jgi:predicted DNA-binding transcriptional regulator AlpA
MTEKLAFKKSEFCAAVSISKSTFYEMRKRGLGPQETDLGTITAEAAQKWLHEREAAGRAGQNPTITDPDQGDLFHEG